MKKIIIGITAINILNAQPMVTQEMIYNSVINAIKTIPDATKGITKEIYETQIEHKKGYYEIFNENQKMKTILKNRNIDYYTVLKQKMYPLKTSDNSREAKIKENRILKKLINKNIKTKNINQTEKHAKAKADLKKQMEL